MEKLINVVCNPLRFFFFFHFLFFSFSFSLFFFFSFSLFLFFSFSLFLFSLYSPPLSSHHTNIKVWTGTTYGLAATMWQEGMIEEGLVTALGIINTTYEDIGYQFQVR